MNERKRKYIEEAFKLDEDSINCLDEFCSFLGTDKYAVWLAKEYRNNLSIISETYKEKTKKIIDWAQSTRPDILTMSYADANEKSEVWHLELFEKSKGKFNIKKATDSRIVYVCSDNEHFFYNLNPSDLKTEGELMGNCVGTNSSYGNRLRRGDIAILSLRDSKNQPHVTIEVDKYTGVTGQIQGKGNQPPITKYLDLITEFGLYASAGSMTEEELTELKKLTKIDKRK